MYPSSCVYLHADPTAGVDQSRDQQDTQHSEDGDHCDQAAVIACSSTIGGKVRDDSSTHAQTRPRAVTPHKIGSKVTDTAYIHTHTHTIPRPHHHTFSVPTCH